MSSQFGYETVKDESFDFSKPDKSYTIPVSMEKSPGKIKGKVLGDNGFPIPEAKILVSNNKKDQIFQSDKNGNFTIFLSEGITSMKISREGYKPKGFIGKKILVSNNKKDQIFQSDKNGNFTIFLSEGITSMKISREGYKPKGFIGKFSRKDTVNLHVFTLDKKTYFISGTAADEILPLRIKKSGSLSFFTKRSIVR